MQRFNKNLAALFAASGVLPLLFSNPLRAQQTAPTAPSATPRAAAKTPAPAAPAANPNPIPANITVAATVNDDKILMTDINAVVTRIRAQQPNIPDADLDNMRRDICEDIIVERLLIQEAKRLKLMPSDQDVNNALWNYKKPFLTEAAFKEHLAAGKKTEEDLRRILAEDLAVATLSRKITADVTISDEEIGKFYNENKAEFVVPEMVRVRHIQISFPTEVNKEGRMVAKTLTEAEKKALLQKAQGALKKVTGGDDFATLAKQLSDDKVSKVNGGDLGFIARDDIMDKAFGDVAFTLAAGKINPKIVETKFGYNIIKVEEKKPARTLSQSEITPYVKPQLMQKKLKEKLDARVAELRKSATIKKNI